MIRWFASNNVAANLLMALLLMAGTYSILQVLPLEVFPDRDVDFVNIKVFQRAAAPEDMETGVTNRIEEAIADLPYIKKLTSYSGEQSSTVSAELYVGTDSQKALNEIKSRVDALSTLPQNAERPVIEIPLRKHEVLSLVVSGDLDEKELSQVARRLRDDIVAEPGISQADIEGVRAYEIAINVSEDRLREYGLSIDSIATAIRAQSLDLSAGQVRSDSGDVLLRAKSQAYFYEQYAAIKLKTFADGSVLHLSDIASIDDGFDENAIITQFNGELAAVVNVYRVGKESAIAVSKAVNEYLEANRHRYPDSVKFGIWDDDSQIVRDRLATLLRSAWQGALLVLLMLTLFLRPTVAFWVVIGIPVCFAGAFALMAPMGITINVASLFGFIMVLGIVVDDAIVTGENIYTHFSNRKNIDGLTAAIEGTEEVARPVIFGILTTIAAFTPMVFMEGAMSTFANPIGGVVVAALFFSLVESKLILPAHLNHLKHPDPNKPHSWLHTKLEGIQVAASNGLLHFIDNVYKPILHTSLRHRYLTLLTFTCITVMAFYSFSTGLTRFTPFPRVPSTTAVAKLTMPVGTPLSVTQAAIDRIEDAVFELKDKYYNEETGHSTVNNILTTIGATGGGRNVTGSSNIGVVRFEIDLSEFEQSLSSNSALIDEWRSLIGPVAGAESLSFRSEIGHFADAIDIQLSSNDTQQIRRAIADIEAHLATFDGVFDISNNLADGKRELQITLKPEAEILGLTLENVTRQVRQAFFGNEAQRIQRQRDDVRVMVKYPLYQRSDLDRLEELLIKAPDGGEARFGDIADVRWGRSPSMIYHVDQRTAVSVTADINKDVVNQSVLNSSLQEYLQTLGPQYPGINFSLEGEAKEQSESLAETAWAGLFVALAIYTLLAIPFSSYSQPFIVMFVIPFAIVGAIAGHWIMALDLSMLSLFGMLALMGIVVNDSLVLVDWVNRRIAQGRPLVEAALEACSARFRPVLLTSLTTFAGLLPMLSSNDTQSAFLVPMATSLAFGVLFATMVTLVIVPCNYLILEDIRLLKERLKGGSEKLA
jgi:multidrug efflux pump subunit AcrB